MASVARTGLTRAEGMRFAFTLGAAFATLSALAAWRQRVLAAEVGFALGLSFLVAGLLVPTQLGLVRRAWMAAGHTIGCVTGPVVLGAIYFVALTPIAYLRRTFGRSPLARDRGAPSYWIPRAPTSAEERRRAFERQF